MYSRARLVSPRRRSVSDSSPNAENVVKPPRMPPTRNRRTDETAESYPQVRAHVGWTHPADVAMTLRPECIDRLPRQEELDLSTALARVGVEALAVGEEPADVQEKAGKQAAFMELHPANEDQWRFATKAGQRPRLGSRRARIRDKFAGRRTAVDAGSTLPADGVAIFDGLAAIPACFGRLVRSL